jgi:hypothetical protein
MFIINGSIAPSGFEGSCVSTPIFEQLKNRVFHFFEVIPFIQTFQERRFILKTNPVSNTHQYSLPPNILT